jgi:hypothetical protein
MNTSSTRSAWWRVCSLVIGATLTPKNEGLVTSTSMHSGPLFFSPEGAINNRDAVLGSFESAKSKA